ncbi:hypothetical protein FB451DRAFT_1568676 [Mycena latifolia]|nr:hypothetical protein FB451DRAFT_1568676 [Mycena latifolia]
MNSTAHLEPFLELMPLHIAVVVASLLCSNREVVSAEWGSDGGHYGAYGLHAADSRGGAMRARVSFKDRARSRRVAVYRREERRYDPGWCACDSRRWCWCPRGAPASRGHDDSARRQAAESAPCAGALVKSPACTTGVLAADSAGSAARASRAETTSPTDSHTGGSGSAR